MGLLEQVYAANSIKPLRHNMNSEV